MGPWLCRAPADPCKADVPGICVSIFIYISCTQIAAAALAQLWHTQGGPKCPGWGLEQPCLSQDSFPPPRPVGNSRFWDLESFRFSTSWCGLLRICEGCKCLGWIPALTEGCWWSPLGVSSCWLLWLYRCSHSAAELFLINRRKAFVSIPLPSIALHNLWHFSSEHSLNVSWILLEASPWAEPSFSWSESESCNVRLLFNLQEEIYRSRA